jgi:GTP-binding protein
VDDATELVVADLPGLIEGASQGRGLGHRFLRHVERARVLVVLVDLSPLAEHPPAEQERILLRELADYQPDLLERPRLVVGSRADLAAPDVPFEGLRISAVQRTGVRELVGQMAEAVQRARAELPEPDAFVVHRPVAEGYRIERGDDGAFHVLGRQAERAVALSDLTNADALDEAHRRLRSLGIDRALARAGAKEGDTVVIGRLAFSYEDDDR